MLGNFSVMKIDGETNSPVAKVTVGPWHEIGAINYFKSLNIDHEYSRNLLKFVKKFLSDAEFNSIITEQFKNYVKTIEPEEDVSMETLAAERILNEYQILHVPEEVYSIQINNGLKDDISEELVNLLCYTIAG